MGSGLALYGRVERNSVLLCAFFAGIGAGVVACGFLGKAGSKSGPELLVALVGAAIPVLAAIGVSRSSDLAKRQAQARRLWGGARHLERALLVLEDLLVPDQATIGAQDAVAVETAVKAVGIGYRKFTGYATPINDPQVDVSWNDAYYAVSDAVQIIVQWAEVPLIELRERLLSGSARPTIHAAVQRTYIALTNFRRVLGNPVVE
jgi:hypothetical protein